MRIFARSSPKSSLCSEICQLATVTVRQRAKLVICSRHWRRKEVAVSSAESSQGAVVRDESGSIRGDTYVVDHANSCRDLKSDQLGSVVRDVLLREAVCVNISVMDLDR